MAVSFGHPYKGGSPRGPTSIIGVAKILATMATVIGTLTVISIGLVLVPSHLVFTESRRSGGKFRNDEILRAEIMKQCRAYFSPSGSTMVAGPSRGFSGGAVMFYNILVVVWTAEFSDLNMSFLIFLNFSSKRRKHILVFIIFSGKISNYIFRNMYRMVRKCTQCLEPAEEFST